MGRPRKSEEERYIVRNMRFPPALWAEFEAVVPSGQRSAVIHDLIARELERRRCETRQHEVLDPKTREDTPVEGKLNRNRLAS